ncbi:hypothetical protein RvY_05324 [Ramazzottius varieornatus]|uniref:Major facilitator superfamily (MFS) profile domain-containing protein n=1 Tax=Ramazzottius varieornatus TaxID=947166 RepID=A0A1D1UV89_RAMVA|nr:hypothetical protein RvY_05324 [Ramazzottius varieornatus]
MRKNSEKVYLSDPELTEKDLLGRANHGGSKKLEEENFRPAPVVVAPDGGYGWIVLIASFVINVVVDGIIFSFGMLSQELMTKYESTDGAVAWVGSMQAGFYLLAGPIVSALCNKYGARKITVIGSFIAALGIAASSFSVNLAMMMVMYGLVSGIGFGFVYLPAIVIVGEYFDKKRALATGIAVSGSGVGGFFFSKVIIPLLLEAYGLQGCLLVLAGISFNCAVFGALFRPLRAVYRREEQEGQMARTESFIQRIQDARDDRIRRLNADSHAEISDHEAVSSPKRLSKIEESDYRVGPEKVEMTYVTGSVGNMKESERMKLSEGQLHRRGSTSSRKSTHSNSSKPMYKPDILYSGSVQNLPEVKAMGGIDEYRRATSIQAVNREGLEATSRGCCPPAVSSVLRQMLDVSLLRSPTFLLTCFTSFLTLAGFFIPFVYIKTFLSSQIGLDDDQSTTVLAAISVTNTLGRIVVGFISDYPRVDTIVVACSALIVGGLATIFAPFYSSYAIFIIYALVFGFAISAFAALRSIILVDLFGIAMLNNSFGLQMTFQGLATLIGSPIAGAIKDATGAYNGTFYFAGVLLTASGILLFPAKTVQRWERRRSGAVLGRHEA